jgi:hypothetical protein
VVLNYVVNEVVEPSSLQVVQQVLSVHLVNLPYESGFAPGRWEKLFSSFSLLLTPPLLGFSEGTFLIRCYGNWVDEAFRHYGATKTITVELDEPS